ncbi:hypothetical protein ACFFRR_002489 [Megaselia abdita]
MFKILFVSSFLGLTLAYNRTLPYSALEGCKEHRIESGYVYTAFRISEFKNNKPLYNEVFRLKFYVFCHSNGLILISNNPNVQSGDSAYEIVLGGWDNSKSAIRNATEGRNLYEKGGPVCSPLYPTEVIVSLTKDGLLSVVLPGFQTPFMFLQDSQPSYNKFVAFSSWKGNAARWFYDCPYYRH